MNRRIFTQLVVFGCVALFSRMVLAGEFGHNYCRYCQQARKAAASADADARKYAPNRQADVLHIRIDVTPDFESRSIEATTTLRFTPIARPLQELRLDAVNLHVKEVRSKWKIDDFHSSDENLTILFAKTIPVGEEVEVEVEYSAEPRKGLYFRTTEMGYDEGDQQIWTQGEPHEARHWFPCFDYPNERSSSEVICHVPDGMTVLSNGKLVGESKDEAEGTYSAHWRQDTPHANYLICLVAGYFDKLEDKHRDIELTFYSQPSISEHAKNAFRDTQNIMAFFEEEIGVDFPWDKYAQVTIMDFMWGGMENTSLTTLTDGTVFSDETENIESSRGLDAHEMAHQWFGDYVTCKDWSHLWLNEGFATYYEALHNGHQFGRDALLFEMYNNAKGVLRQGKNDRRPLVFKDYGHPDEQFDYRAYPKGSWVLHMLRSQLGEELYRKCIRTYLERHALTSVVTEELNSVIEEVSGQSFDQFFDQWVYHARHPDLRISYRWMASEKLAKVTIEQTHEVNDDWLLFEFPSKLRFKVGDESIDHEIDVSERKNEYFVRLPKRPDIVRFDPDYTVLAEVSFRKSDAMLLKQLEDESDMIGRIFAIRALAKRKTNAATKALRNALNQDKFFGVRQEAAKGLREINSDAAFEALVESAEQSDARVRRTVVEQIGAFYRTDAKQKLCSLIDSEKNPAIVETAVRALGKYSGRAVDDRIISALESDSFRNRTVAGAISAIRTQGSAKFRGPLMELLRDRGDDLTTWQMSRGLSTLCKLPGNKKARMESLEFVSQYLEHPRTGYRVAAIRGLGELGHPKGKRILRAFEDDPNSRIAEAAKEALGKIDKYAPGNVEALTRTIDGLRRRQEALEDQIDDLEAMIEAHGATVNEIAEVQAEGNGERKDKESDSKAAETVAKDD